MKNKIIIILSAMLIISSLTFAEKPAIWEQKINAQIKYQKKVAEILLKEEPGLKEIIIINRDLQVTMYEMKRERYLYLVDNYPGRIGPGKELNFKWTDEDENNLTQSSRNYASLKKKEEELKTKNQSHPMWPALREAFKRVKNTKEYKEAQDALMKMLRR
ncbi:MAG: hypothetical protein A4E64_01091 [Syntrophorhabdus sp. PtaU1.Bin058]|nr:MAG: hypothetical protein A4E64_01091 [Syntrophorhabdus sp. PtaU1.Bin058]